MIVDERTRRHITGEPQIIKARGRYGKTMIVAGRYRKKDGMPRLQEPFQVQRRRRIDDVYPALPMKVYGIEKDVEQLRQNLDRHMAESVEAGKRNAECLATKESVADLEKQLQGEIRDVHIRLDKRAAWIVLQTAGLIASTAYALILSYKHFIQ